MLQLNQEKIHELDAVAAAMKKEDIFDKWASYMAEFMRGLPINAAKQFMVQAQVDAYNISIQQPATSTVIPQESNHPITLINDNLPDLN